MKKFISPSSSPGKALVILVYVLLYVTVYYVYTGIYTRLKFSLNRARHIEFYGTFLLTEMEFNGDITTDQVLKKK